MRATLGASQAIALRSAPRIAASSMRTPSAAAITAFPATAASRLARGTLHAPAAPRPRRERSPSPDSPDRSARATSPRGRSGTEERSGCALPGHHDHGLPPGIDLYHAAYRHLDPAAATPDDERCRLATPRAGPYLLHRAQRAPPCLHAKPFAPGKPVRTDRAPPGEPLLGPQRHRTVLPRPRPFGNLRRRRTRG